MFLVQVSAVNRNKPISLESSEIHRDLGRIHTAAMKSSAAVIDGLYSFKKGINV